MLPLAKLRIPLALIGFFFLNLSITSAQSEYKVSFSNFQKEDGLPSNHISSIEKDRLGFLWVATNDGLCRYDGPNLVKVYQKISGVGVDTMGLRSNNVTALHSDSNGKLWVGTRHGGLNRLDPIKNTWETYRHDPTNNSSLSNDEVLTILEDSKNQIWVGTEKGLNLLDQKTNTFKRIQLLNVDNKPSDKIAVLSVMEDSRGWIWAGTWSGGIHLVMNDNNESNNQDRTRNFQVNHDIAANNVWCLFEDKQGRFWIGTHGGGLFIMNLPKEASSKALMQNWSPSFQHYTAYGEYAPNLRSNGFQAIAQDQFDNMWFGTTGGLFRLLKKDLPTVNAQKRVPLKFEAYSSSLNNEGSITSPVVTDILEDNQGMIWVSTPKGLNQYSWYSNQFSNMLLADGDLNLVNASNLFVDKKGNLWTATSNAGLQKFELINNELIKVDEDFNQLLLGGEIASMMHSPNGDWLYVGTRFGITAIELNTLKTKSFPTPEWVLTEIKNLAFSSILVDNSGTIWAGTNLGLFRIDSDTKEYEIFRTDKGDSKSICDNSIIQVMQDSRGAIWIGTYNGLSRILNPQQENIEFDQFHVNSERPEKGPQDNQIMYIKEAQDALFIGTTSGLSKYDFESKLFKTFPKVKSKFWVQSIEEGVDQNLWISTTEGIIFFDSKAETAMQFDQKDGLNTSSYLLGSSCKDYDNNIYFGYKNGVTYFSPEKLSFNSTPPPVYITDLEKMTPNGTIRESGILKEEYILNHNDYRMSVNFAALNYIRSDKNQYKYRLVGFEENWNEAKAGTPIVYTNLEPKTYYLEVLAANNDGVWNETGTSLKIIQKRPYWQTFWFRSLAFCFCASILLLGFIWYTNNMRRHNDELQRYNDTLNQEVAQRRSAEQKLSVYNQEIMRSNKDLEQFAYVASHDLKEPLRVIGNFSGLLARKFKGNIDPAAKEYIGFIVDGVDRMGKVIDSLLTFSSVGQSNKGYQETELNKLVEGKLLDLSQLVKRKNAKVSVENLPELVGDRQQLGIVFYNLINNGLKYNTSENPRVLVKAVSENDAFWKFSIADNGIGIDEKYQEKIFGLFKRLHGKGEFEGTGIGLSICQKIVQSHSGRIWFESVQGEGTTFFFTIKKDLPKATPTKMSYTRQEEINV